MVDTRDLKSLEHNARAGSSPVPGTIVVAPLFFRGSGAFFMPDSFNSFLMMLHFERTDSGNPDFIELVRLLDADLAIRDGDDHAFYAQFNKIDAIRHVIVAYDDQKPVGCGAFKPFDAHTVEIKRMFVRPEWRGKGIAAHIVQAMETWAAELSVARCVLETGKQQPEAIALYTKCGYVITPNFGQYIGVDNSVCFEKIVKTL